MNDWQPTPEGLRSRTFRQFKDGVWHDFEDVVTVEERVLLHWPGRAPVNLLAFPEHLEALVLGHALLDCCEPGQVPCLVKAGEREFFLEPVADTRPGNVKDIEPLAPELVLEQMGAFIEAGGRWDDTGCFHRAALFDPVQNAFIHHVEDIGRHNCLDRVAGHCLAKGISLGSLVLFVSARATGSLVAKAVRAGFPMMVSRSAVTIAGLEAAEAASLTLVGFARRIRFTVFTDSSGLVIDHGKGGA